MQINCPHEWNEKMFLRVRQREREVDEGEMGKWLGKCEKLKKIYVGRERVIGKGLEI